jgi:hypothetical protein
MQDWEEILRRSFAVEMMTANFEATASGGSCGGGFGHGAVAVAAILVVVAPPARRGRPSHASHTIGDKRP